MKSISKTLVLLAIFITFMSFKSIAQVKINTNPFWQGEITLVDGTVKKGYVRVPNHSREKKIAFKKSLKSKKETIKRKLIKTVRLVSNTGRNYLYECLPLVNTLKGNASLGKSLILVEAKNDYVTFYIESGAYKVNKKKGEIGLIYRYQQGKDFPVIARYIRKKDAPKANMFYMSGYIGGFKKSAKHHLVEDEELQRRIANGALGKKDIPEIINTYLETTETMQN